MGNSTSDNPAVAKEYDVGISFLAPDEAQALDLAKRLAPLRVFVYSQRQQELAGTNAAESFRDIFRNKIRVQVVLFREGWGETPITRVESTAIQEYCLYEGGWDKLMFVTLDSSGNLPKWLHRHHIRFDLQTFPIDQLVGAIKKAVLDAGGEIRRLTAAERARQIAEREEFDRETERLLTVGGQTFRNAADQLFAALDEQIAAIRNESGWTIVHGHQNAQYVAFLDRVTMQLLPQALYVNTSRDAFFFVRSFNGRLLTPGETAQGLMTWGQPDEIHREELKLRRELGIGWIWEFRDKLQPHAEVARVLLTEFLERRTEAMRQ